MVLVCQVHLLQRKEFSQTKWLRLLKNSHLSVSKLASLLRITVNFEETCLKFYVKLQNKKPVLKKIYSSEKSQSCREEEEDKVRFEFCSCYFLKKNYDSFQHLNVCFSTLPLFLQCFLDFLLKNMVDKFPDCYCCNCLGERRWEWWPRSHCHKHIPSVCQVTLRCEHALLCFFDFVFHFVCDGWQNWAMRLHQVPHEAR
jgi:hypothetical protein